MSARTTKSLGHVVGALLLPACFAATRAVVCLVRTAQPANPSVSPAAWALAGGFLVWLFFFFTLPRPVRAYVLAHELTHALWGAMMGARVSGIKVSGQSGSVTLSKTNFAVTLAPYFFPLYTILVIAVYALLSVFVDVSPYYPFWLALVGFTWGFHLTFTLTTLAQRQADIRACGHLFSYTVIYLFNILGIGLWIVAVSASTLEHFVECLAKYGAATALAAWQLTSTLMERMRQ